MKAKKAPRKASSRKTSKLEDQLQQRADALGALLSQQPTEVKRGKNGKVKALVWRLAR
jgi:hypothetical protein